MAKPALASVCSGVFFSDEAMRERNPVGFDEFVGRHMSQEERRVLASADGNPALAHLPLAGFLMNALGE